MGISTRPRIAESSRVLAENDEMRVEELTGRIYVVRVFRCVSRGVLAAALKVIWASPRWHQPWGLVVEMDDDATYDGDVRQHEMPPNDRRAVGTAVVTCKQSHRMVIKSIGLGYGIVSRFILTAHEDLEPAIAAQREAVARAQAKGRAF
jgi:hypothetical protein